MAKFSYEAINEGGGSVSGSIEADSADMAEDILVSRGLIPSSVKSARADDTTLLGRIERAVGGVQVGDLIIFSKQFRSMMQAGIPIVRILGVLENQTENKILRGAITKIGEDIKRGETLYDAMKAHPRIFSPLYLSMIRAGELSGTIPEVMSRLISIIEHEAKVKNDVRAALQYPIIVVIALGLAFFILLTFVIPKFIDIFMKVGIALPFPTKVAMMLYQFLANYWYILIIGLVVLIGGLQYWFKTENGRFQRDSFLLRLPLFGILLQKAALSRFASIFAILQSSGVPVMQALEVLSGTIGNAAISRQFDMVRERVREGQGISGPLEQAKYFTPMVIDMVAIGEESGNIDEMLHQISVHYDDEVAYEVKKLSDSLGPILIVGLAAVVGFFALAIFLPMWDMTKMVK